MKNINSYEPHKYKDSPLYAPVEDHIYLYDNPPDETYGSLQRFFKRKESHGQKYRYGLMFTSQLEPKHYVTSLVFEQEPQFGEGDSPTNISQYPLEDILDEFGTWVSDFYYDLNTKSAKKCYQEFASRDPEDLKKLLSIVGRHVYERPSNEDNDSTSFVIE